MKPTPSSFRALVHTRGALSLATLAFATGLSMASSHREAPLITSTPKLDCSDYYAFNSYEPGRNGFVTLIANYLPLQDAYGGPNYFTLDPKAVYEIHVDNNGDAVEDITFQFRFSNVLQNIALPIGPEGNRRTNAVPVVAVGPIAAGKTGALNLVETYTLNIIRGPRRSGTSEPVKNAQSGATVFTKPLDNVGNKTIPDYEAYASSHVYNIQIPGCATPGRMFVGQRKDPFVVNLGETFDLVNISNPLGAVDGAKDSLTYKNVTALVLEIPKECLIASTEKPVIGSWTTSSVEAPESTPAKPVWKQMSRLGMPLVNELVIGVGDKDRFNGSEPKDDGQIVDYVTHPTLPAILELLFGGAGVKAPTVFPRTDLVAVFATGVTGLNVNGSVAEVLRLNTSTDAVPAAKQKELAVLAGDTAGFPNGRRPGDDVVDIALRVVMGALLPLKDAPSGQLPFTDGALVNASQFPDRFPYLNPPIAGSPNDPYINILLQSSARVQGPYQTVPATYNAATRTLTTDRTGSGEGYFRLKADGKVALDTPKASATGITVGVK